MSHSLRNASHSDACLSTQIDPMSPGLRYRFTLGFTVPRRWRWFPVNRSFSKKKQCFQFRLSLFSIFLRVLSQTVDEPKNRALHSSDAVPESLLLRRIYFSAPEGPVAVDACVIFPTVSGRRGLIFSARNSACFSIASGKK